MRQILPLRYSTYYFTSGEDDAQFVNVDFWRMWLGHVFDHEHRSWRIVS